MHCNPTRKLYFEMIIVKVLSYPSHTSRPHVSWHLTSFVCVSVQDNPTSQISVLYIMSHMDSPKNLLPLPWVPNCLHTVLFNSELTWSVWRTVPSQIVACPFSSCLTCQVFFSFCFLLIVSSFYCDNGVNDIFCKGSKNIVVSWKGKYEEASNYLDMLHIHKRLPYLSCRCQLLIIIMPYVLISQVFCDDDTDAVITGLPYKCHWSLPYFIQPNIFPKVTFWTDICTVS